MNFNKHSDLIGQHAFLSASKYYWINYDEDKLIKYYEKMQAVERGVKLHEFACTCIQLKQKLPRSKKTLNQYVNDAIGFNMTPEQVLYYSENCFGTADAIGFKNDILRIHDLKTGETPASFHQLEIYTALFCLEYKVKPNDIFVELRIYQSDEVKIYEPEKKDIIKICDKIMTFDKRIENIKER